MTRRAAARTTHKPSLPLLAGMLVAGLAAGLLAACGGSSGGSTPAATATMTVTVTPSASPSASPSPSPSAPAWRAATLYFLRNGQLCAVARQMRSNPASALNALLRGSTASERAAGVASAIPRGVRQLALTDSGDGNVVVDLSQGFARTGSPDDVRARMAQLVYTLSAAGPPPASSSRVDLHVNGVRIAGLPSTGGDVEYTPTRRGYTSLEPAIFVARPAMNAVVSSPLVLSGRASVFEGTFNARLVDAGGGRITTATVQASRGAPGRGSFRRSMPFGTTAAHGTLVVYSVSMEDGSHQNEVRIPVTFAQD